MAFAFKNLVTGVVNSTSPATVYTAPPAGTKVQEITFGNASGADADVIVTMAGQFYGRYTVPGADTVRGNQLTNTMNKGLNSGETLVVNWLVASAFLTHHVSGTELG